MLNFTAKIMKNSDNYAGVKRVFNFTLILSMTSQI
jgi:hypothetical protein